MVYNSLCVAAWALCFWVGGTTAGVIREHSRSNTVPSGFTLVGAASADTVLNLRIAMAQSDPAGLEKALYDVSTPSSPNYGQHLTKDEVCV